MNTTTIREATSYTLLMINFIGMDRFDRILRMLKNDLMCNCFGAYVLRCQTDVDKVVLNNVKKNN